jgi:AP-3 complex subunit beta
MLAVCRVFYYLGPKSYTAKIVNPLLRLMSISKEIERVALPYVYVVSHAHPVSQ